MHPTLKCKQHSWTHRDFIPRLAATMDWETQASGCWQVTLTLTVSVVFGVSLILVAPFSMSGLWSSPIRVAKKKRLKVTWKVTGLLKNKIYLKLTSHQVKVDVHIQKQVWQNVIHVHIEKCVWQNVIHVNEQLLYYYRP